MSKIGLRTGFSRKPVCHKNKQKPQSVLKFKKTKKQKQQWHRCLASGLQSKVLCWTRLQSRIQKASEPSEVLIALSWIQQRKVQDCTESEILLKAIQLIHPLQSQFHVFLSKMLPDGTTWDITSSDLWNRTINSQHNKHDIHALAAASSPAEESSLKDLLWIIEHVRRSDARSYPTGCQLLITKLSTR